MGPAITNLDESVRLPKTIGELLGFGNESLDPEPKPYTLGMLGREGSHSRIQLFEKSQGGVVIEPDAT